MRVRGSWEPSLDFAPGVRRRVLGGSLSQTERSPAQFVGRAVGLPEGVIDGQDEAVPLEMLGAGAGVIDQRPTSGRGSVRLRYSGYRWHSRMA